LRKYNQLDPILSSSVETETCQNFLLFNKSITGNMISLSDLLLPAGVAPPAERLRPGKSEPVPLLSEHPYNAACTLPSQLLFYLKLELHV
jgi:hypothetical protein